MVATPPLPGISAPDVEPDARPEDNAEMLRNADPAPKNKAKKKKPKSPRVFYDLYDFSDIFKYLEDNTVEGQTVDREKAESLLEVMGNNIESVLFNKRASIGQEAAFKLIKTFHDTVELESDDQNRKIFKVGDAKLTSASGKHSLEKSNTDGGVTYEQTLALYIMAMNDPAIKAADNRMRLTGTDAERADMQKHIEEIEKTIAPEHRLKVQEDFSLKGFLFNTALKIPGASVLFKRKASDPSVTTQEKEANAAAARKRDIASDFSEMQSHLEENDRLNLLAPPIRSGEKELYQYTLYHRENNDGTRGSTNLWFEKTDGKIKIIKAKRGADEYADPDADPRAIEMLNGAVATAAPDQDTPSPVTGGGTPSPDSEAPPVRSNAPAQEEKEPSTEHNASSPPNGLPSPAEDEPDYPLNHRLQRTEVAKSLAEIEKLLNGPESGIKSPIQTDFLDKSGQPVYSEHLLSDGKGEYRSDVKVFFINEGTAFKVIGFNGADGSFYRDEDPKYRMVGDEAVSLTETPQPEAALPTTTEVRKTHPPAPGPVATGTPSESPRNDFTFETGQNNSDANAEPVRRLTPEELREVSRGVPRHRVQLDPNAEPPAAKTVTVTFLEKKMPEIQAFLKDSYDETFERSGVLENDGRSVFKLETSAENEKGQMIDLKISFIDEGNEYRVVAIDGSDGSIYRAEGAEYRIQGDTAVAARRQIEPVTPAAASQQKAFGAQSPSRAAPACASARTDFSAASTFLGEVDDRAMEALDRMQKEFVEGLPKATGASALRAPAAAGPA